jgi:hypothetical protein
MYSSAKGIMTHDESDFQVSKWGSVDARNHWAEDLMTLEESFFQAVEMLKCFQKEPCNLEWKISRPAINRIFRPPKYRISAHWLPLKLEPSV